MKSRTILQAAGVAALVLFPTYANVIDSSSELRMHTPAPLTPFVLSIVANLALVFLASALLGSWLQRNSQWTWWKLLLPGFVLASLAEMIYVTRIGYESGRLWIVALAIVIGVTVLLHWSWPRGEKLLLQLSKAMLAGLGFFCLFVILQLLYLATWRPLSNATVETATSAMSNASDRPRIVWILFDELSYQQVFGDRYPGLQLPNFDTFSKSSIVFTNVQPLVNETEKAVPSILLGQHVDRVDYTFRNQLKVGIRSGSLHPFDAAQTPFAFARRSGLTTGVVGWYIPYCSALAPYLNQCYWTDELLAPTVFAKESFWQNFLDPWEYYARSFYSNGQQKSLVDRARAYQGLMRRADQMLQPSGPDFVLLHLPLPHPQGFYNRETGQFDASGKRSYIDNLALADKTLGQVLSILEQSPRWKNTSVVICGDHSWRVYKWSRSFDWSAEDQAASHGGVFDPRPMIMIHMAAQSTASTVNTPFPLVDLHGILDDLVQGKQPSLQLAGAKNDVH